MKVKVSEFLKMNAAELSDYLRGTEFVKTERLCLFGWQWTTFAGPKVIKKLGANSIFIYSFTGRRRAGVKMITIWTIDDHKIIIYVSTRTGEVISRYCGKDRDKGNRLTRITPGKSFWDNKKKKWRWEE